MADNTISREELAEVFRSAVVSDIVLSVRKLSRNELGRSYRFFPPSVLEQMCQTFVEATQFEVASIKGFGDDDVTPVTIDDDTPVDWSGFWRGPRQEEDVKAKRKREGVCPECGHKGDWIGLALICPEHGRFAG